MRGNDYIVTEKGKEVMVGSQHKVGKFLNMGRNRLYQYCKSGDLIDGRYNVRSVPHVREAKEKPKPQQKTVREQNLEYLFTHLRIYGNVASVFDPVPYLPDLFERGLDCSVQEIVSSTMRCEMAEKRMKNKKKDIFYITEVRA